MRDVSTATGLLGGEGRSEVGGLLAQGIMNLRSRCGVAVEWKWRRRQILAGDLPPEHFHGVTAKTHFTCHVYNIRYLQIATITSTWKAVRVDRDAHQLAQICYE